MYHGQIGHKNSLGHRWPPFICIFSSRQSSFNLLCSTAQHTPHPIYTMCNIIFICRIYELCYICSMSFINKLGIHKPKYTHTTLLSIHSSGISLELNGPIWDAISSVFFTSDEFLVYYFASVVMIINISFVILERDHQENLWCGILWNNVRYVATNCRRLWFIYSSTWTTTSPHRTLSSVCYFCFFLCSVYLWTIAVDEKKKGEQ